MFFCEETQEEIDRKFSAIVDSWSLQDREKAIENFRAISFIGKDARLTLISGKQYTGSGMTEKILQLLEEFGLKDGLVIFDHTQGFTSGDLNSSETSTSICLEANKIVEATGAAVVLAAHVSKANINADSVGQGFAVGSLAFENATRQMSGMTHMSTEQAKKFGLEGLHKDYVRLGVAKNSYGEITDGLWLKKVFSLKFHTVVFEPVQLFIPISTGKLTANQRLSSQIKAHLAKHLFTTKNNLDALSGKDEDFKASKGKIRDAVKDLIDRGELIIHSITEEERELHHLPKQVKEVLRVA
jgi:RecA-family ATPase